MKLKDKNILIISPESWSHIFVSKHHYAVHLAERGNNVFFLSPPSKVNGLFPTIYNNLWQIEYTGFVRGLRFLPRYIQRLLLKKKFDFLEKICQVQFDVVWSFDTSVFFDFSAFRSNILKISHIVDLNQNYQLIKSVSTADICFCSTEVLKDKLLAYNKNTFKINHGFNQKKFQKDTITLPGRNSIKCLYAGNLDIPYVDWDLITTLVDQFEDIDFIFMGSWTRTRQTLMEKSNFHYLGVVESSALASYYIFADILLICYRNNEFPDQLANPHKVMEYLGSGKVVVATWTEEYKSFIKDQIILMSVNKRDFIENFKKVLESTDHFNNKDLSHKRTQIALDNTYEKQIDRIEKILNSVLLK